MALTQVSTAGVKDDAVTAGKIPANAVGSSELADNAVDTAAITDDAVTAAKIANIDGNINVNDSVKIRFGTHGDLDIYHDGTDSYIANANGALIITQHNNDIKLRPKTAEEGIIINNDGAVELYYNNSKKLETTSSGVSVSGNCNVDGNITLSDNEEIQFGNSTDFRIYHNGTHSYIRDVGTGGINLDASNLYIRSASGNETLATFNENGAVELYYNNSKKLETTDTGLSIAGNTLAVKPVKTIVNSNQSPSTGIRFEVPLPTSSRMFKITGTFSFSGNGTGVCYADLGDWSDGHTASVEGVTWAFRNGATSDVDDTGSSRYQRVTPSTFDAYNLECAYEVFVCSVPFQNGNDTGTQGGGARPSVFGQIKFTKPSIGVTLCTFACQDNAAQGNVRMNSFAWDIDGGTGSLGTGQHTYVLEEYPLT